MSNLYQYSTLSPNELAINRSEVDKVISKFYGYYDVNVIKFFLLISNVKLS